jgi:quinol monooxygenase YgiN
MQTRIVSFTVQPQHREKVQQILDGQIASELRKLAGFVDFCVLRDKDDQNRFLSLTFWNTRQDADRYHHDQYPKLRGLVDPYMTKPGEMHEFDVYLSTSHRIAAGKAA